MSYPFRELAECEPRNAPLSIEVALLKEFRSRRAVRRWSIAVGAIAACLCAVAVLWVPETPSPPVQLVHVIPPSSAFPSTRRIVQPVSSPVRAGRRRWRHTNQEVADGFQALPGASMLPPLDYGTVVRVELPRSALTFVGLPVNEDRAFERVRADVLLGQDGQARAVRFIQ